MLVYEGIFLYPLLSLSFYAHTPSHSLATSLLRSSLSLTHSPSLLSLLLFISRSPLSRFLSTAISSLSPLLLSSPRTGQRTEQDSGQGTGDRGQGTRPDHDKSWNVYRTHNSIPSWYYDDNILCVIKWYYNNTIVSRYGNVIVRCYLLIVLGPYRMLQYCNNIYIYIMMTSQSCSGIVSQHYGIQMLQWHNITIPWSHNIILIQHVHNTNLFVFWKYHLT